MIAAKIGRHHPARRAFIPRHVGDDSTTLRRLNGERTPFRLVNGKSSLRTNFIRPANPLQELDTGDRSGNGVPTDPADHEQSQADEHREY